MSKTLYHIINSDNGITSFELLALGCAKNMGTLRNRLHKFEKQGIVCSFKTGNNLKLYFPTDLTEKKAKELEKPKHLILEDRIFSIIKDSKRFLITSDFFNLKEAMNTNYARTAVQRLANRDRNPEPILGTVEKVVINANSVETASSYTVVMNTNSVRTAVQRLEKKNKIKAIRTTNSMKLYCLSNKFEELKQSKDVKVDKKVFKALTQDRRTLSFYEISQSSGIEDDEVLKECLYRLVATYKIRLVREWAKTNVKYSLY